jgi:ABC-2 type transport system ATP-binding protein
VNRPDEHPSQERGTDRPEEASQPPPGRAPADTFQERTDSASSAAPASAAEPPTTDRPRPAVEARRLGLHGRDRWVYRDVDLSLPPGAVLAIAGPRGSGRSSLLLTLTGRMRPTDGHLTVLGHPLPYEARAVRRLAAVARAGRAVGLEPWLTVWETVRERALLDVVSAARAQERFARACELLGLDLHPHGLVEDLSGVEQTLLATAVAVVGSPQLLVLDDVDAGLHSHEETRVWRGLRALAADGVTVAATTTDTGPAQGFLDTVLRLDADVSSTTTRGRFR